MNKPQLEPDHKSKVNSATLDVLNDLYSAIDRVLEENGEFGIGDTVTIMSNVLNSYVMSQLDLVSNAKDNADALVGAVKAAWLQKLYLLRVDIDNYGEI